MRTKTLLTAAAAMTAIGMLSTSTQAELILNGSFENVELDGNPNDLGTNIPETNSEARFITGIAPWTLETAWTAQPRIIDLSTTNGNYNIIAGVDGDQFLAIQQNGAFTISQTLGSTLQADTDYTLSSTIGTAFDEATAANSVAGLIQLIADRGGVNETVVASIAVDGTDFIGAANHRTLLDFSDTGSITAGSAAIGTSLTVVLTGDNAVNRDTRLVLDDVSVVAVPEPGSLALLGLGGLCVLRRRRD